MCNNSRFSLFFTKTDNSSDDILQNVGSLTCHVADLGLILETTYDTLSMAIKQEKLEEMD